MRLALLTVADHLYANRVVNHLLAHQEVVGIAESDVLLHGRTRSEALRRYWETSGPDYVLHQGLKQGVTRAATGLCATLGRGRPGDCYFGYRRTAAARGIPVARVARVNGARGHSLLRAWQPDLLVSVFFNQILTPSTLALAKLGAINGHPAALPRYRGVSPVFWALANGESQVGFTVHRIDRDIDTGEVLAQATVAVRPEDTEHSLYWRLAGESLPLFDAALRLLASGASAAVTPPEGEPSYYSLPTREAVRRFRQGGRRFFRVGELLGAAR